MDGIESLRERVEALAGLADVDPDALSGDQALEWARGLVRARNSLDVLTAPLVARMEELSQGPGRFARDKGYGSAAALMSGATGLPTSDAYRLLALGKAMTRTVEVAADARVPDAGAGTTPGDGLDLDALSDGSVEPTLEPASLPTSPTPLAPPAPAPVPVPVRVVSPLAQAARDGVLGAEKIRIIEVTVAAMAIDTTQFETDAVAKATSLSLRQLQVWCLRQFAQRDPQAYEARQERQRDERFLAFSPQADGMVKISGMLDAATAAPVQAWFGPQTRAAMSNQRDWADNEKRSIRQINADILAALARHAEGCEAATTRPKTTVVVRVGLDVLKAEAGFADCDSLQGPISYATLRRMAVDAEFLPVVLGGASLPVDVGRARRGFTDAQRIVIGERDQGCAWCTAPMAWCDTHHIRFWSRRGRTDAKNGVLLCVSCHHRVHDHGWDIEVTPTGEISFIPPDTVDPLRRRQPASSDRLAS